MDIRSLVLAARVAEAALAEKYEDIIKNAVLAALASGVIPFSDAVIMSGIWGTMIVSLAVQSGHPYMKCVHLLTTSSKVPEVFLRRVKAC